MQTQHLMMEEGGVKGSMILGRMNYLGCLPFGISATADDLLVCRSGRERVRDKNAGRFSHRYRLRQEKSKSHVKLENF
jgi:hypothetical protein